MQAQEFVSQGVYTVAEAARLIRETPRKVRRWAFGYKRLDTEYAPAIATDLPLLDDTPALTFRELVELMFIQAFLESGASWRKVRTAAVTASVMFDTTHPFAMRKWFADPGGIYTLLEAEPEKELFVELSGAGQLAMRSTLTMYLEQLDFDLEGFAERWYPLGKDVPVVVDPKRAFGAPVVQGTRVPTAVLAETYSDPESVDEIAWWYGLRPAEVHAAIRFERELAVA